MVKLYKNWYLDADDHQYVVGRTTEDLRSGNLVRSIQDPVKFDTAVEAIQHVLETETRDIVKETDERKKEILREYWREYRRTHPEQIRNIERRYRENHREQLNAYQREYRKANAEKVNAYQREYRRANPDRVKAWRENSTRKQSENVGGEK